jgi:hypothetical protein
MFVIVVKNCVMLEDGDLCDVMFIVFVFTCFKTRNYYTPNVAMKCLIPLHIREVPSLPGDRLS